MANMPVRQALEQYRERVSILKKGYEQEKYRVQQIARSFLGRKTVRKVSSVDIATYRDQRLQTINPRTQKPISASTVRLELSLLSSFFDISRIEWGLCDDNPVKNVRKPKPPPGRDRTLTPREERQILRYCFAHSNPELYSIVVLALETAMRQGEILKLRWEHINIKTRIAHLPETKNGCKRDVPLSITARDALIRLGTKSTGAVFRYTSNGIKSTWRFMIQKLNIEDLHFHDLRHTAVTALFRLGTLNTFEIAAISGHKSMQMLRRYTHLQAKDLITKLDGRRSKGKQAVIDAVVPYPAVIDEQQEGVMVRILDFEDLAVARESRKSAIAAAQDALLREILRLIRDSEPIPAPDQYLDAIEERHIVMIDPMGAAMA